MHFVSPVVKEISPTPSLVIIVILYLIVEGFYTVQVSCQTLLKLLHALRKILNSMKFLPFICNCI